MDSYDLTKEQLNKLIREVNIDITPASGVSLAHPKYFPNTFKEVGIQPRDSSRNTLLGTIVSKPTEFRDSFIIGVSYHDKIEDLSNEDFFEVDLNGQKIKKYKPSEFEKTYPEYKDKHKELKEMFY